jgi:IS5 family transposase
MLKPINATVKWVTTSEEEILEKMISNDHAFRKLKTLIDFDALLAPYRSTLYSDVGATGLDIGKGFRALLIQFWEDYSDRQMEKALQENVALKWFCGFGLLEATPDHSYFGKLRKRLGAEKLSRLFRSVNDALEKRGLFGNVFTFIDASAIVTKTALWEERDRAIKDGEEKLNNANVNRYASDPEARWGAKSKKKIWFGYKRHHGVDMRFGLIAKVAVTPANVQDYEMTESVCPDQGMVFQDKMYDCKKADIALKKNGCAAGTIRKNNNKQKNRDLDRWRSGIRMPFEGTFSKLNHRARYRGRVRVLFQCFAEAMCHNLKKAIHVLPMETFSES